MNRNTWIAIIAAIIIVGGIWYYSQPDPVAVEGTNDAATQTGETATDAADTATDAATDAADTATDAATDAADTATDAATDAADTATDAATDAADTATDAATDAAGLFDPANFDADKLKATIDASTLDDATKTSLKSAVDAAQANPDLVQSTLDQVKAALGM